jgi:hypothetical protein
MWNLKWPDKPLCHGESPRFSTNGVSWRPAYPDGSPHRGRLGEPIADGQYPGPYGYPFRACSYCGSIHPEDLWMLLTGHRLLTEAEQAKYGTRYCLLTDRPEVKLGGSDWKYGWPHKFYVEGIPNPIAGKDCIASSTTFGNKDEALADARYGKPVITEEEQLDGRTIFHVGWLSPAPETTHAKWYNDHLRDFTDEPTFEEFAKVLFRSSGVQFGLKAGVGSPIVYHAPYSGFQQ